MVMSGVRSPQSGPPVGGDQEGPRPALFCFLIWVLVTLCVHVVKLDT